MSEADGSIQVESASGPQSEDLKPDKTVFIEEETKEEEQETHKPNSLPPQDQEKVVAVIYWSYWTCVFINILIGVWQKCRKCVALFFLYIIIRVDTPRKKTSPEGAAVGESVQCCEQES